MKIILVGCGKVGTALARQLSEEGHNVTIIDTNKARVEHISESYDVMGITGNGSSITTLSEAGIEEADVFIAVTGSDELNLLCCMFAKKAGHCHAIARVRNPSYSHELDFIKKQIGISAIINPEMAAAREISHLLRFPGASKIDTFAEGRVRLIKFTLTEAQILCEDGSNREFLLSEGLTSTEAFVALTNIDEENVLLTLFAKKHSNGKLVTKINRLEFDDILAGLDLGSIVYPKYMTCDYIVQYVRALQNEAGSNIKTLYRILDDRVEALEFTVHEKSRATGVPLSQLHLKKNLLLCCITRGNEIKIPRGGDEIQVGDNVIVVTLEHGLHDLRDIVED